MKSVNKSLGFLSVLAAIAVVTMVTAACPSNAIHVLNRTDKQVSDDLSQAEAFAEQLYVQGTKETDTAVGQTEKDDAKAIASFVVEASGDHKVLTAELRALPNVQGSNAIAAIQYLQAFVAKVHTIDLHLKSKAAQDRANLFFAGFDASVNTLIATLQSIKGASLYSRGPIQQAGIDPQSEVALALLAWGAIAGLIAKYKSDGALTDQQLQDAADAEDDETKKAALAFLVGK